MLPQLIVSGAAAGSLYGLLALGFVLIYKATRILNFALGEMAMFGAYLAFTLLTAFHWPQTVAFPVTVIACAFLGFCVERISCRPLINASHITVILATLAMSIILQNVAQIIWGARPYTFPFIFEQVPYHWKGIVLARENFWTFLVSLISICIFFPFYRFTKMGKAIRATAQNRDAAILMGINVDMISALVWTISALLGGITGILLATIVALSPHMGVVAIKAFSAAILGGLTSLPGAVIGGIILGIMENLTGAYVSIQLKESTVFLFIILILVVRPEGIFIHQVKKRV